MSLTTPDLLECADEEERMSDIGDYLYVRWESDLSTGDK